MSTAKLRNWCALVPLLRMRPMRIAGLITAAKARVWEKVQQSRTGNLQSKYESWDGPVSSVVHLGKPIMAAEAHSLPKYVAACLACFRSVVSSRVVFCKQSSYSILFWDAGVPKMALMTENAIWVGCLLVVFCKQSSYSSFKSTNMLWQERTAWCWTQ